MWLRVNLEMVMALAGSALLTAALALAVTVVAYSHGPLVGQLEQLRANGQSRELVVLSHGRPDMQSVNEAGIVRALGTRDLDGTDRMDGYPQCIDSAVPHGQMPTPCCLIWWTGDNRSGMVRLQGQ